jgi:hypothetical protein
MLLQELGIVDTLFLCFLADQPIIFVGNSALGVTSPIGRVRN